MKQIPWPIFASYTINSLFSYAFGKPDPTNYPQPLPGVSPFSTNYPVPTTPNRFVGAIMAQEIDNGGALWDPKQQQSLADIVHGNNQSVSGPDADSERSSGLESPRIDTQKDGPGPGSHAATRCPHSAGKDVNITAEVPKSPDQAPDIDPTRSSVGDVGTDSPTESREANDSGGFNNATMVCATCEKHKDMVKFRDRRFKNIQFAKNCLGCRDEKKSKTKKGPKSRRGQVKPETKKKEGGPPRASAQKSQDKEASAAKLDTRGGTAGASNVGINAPVVPSQKRGLPTDFDNQGPKKHVKANEQPTPSQQPTTTKQPTAKEPPSPSEQPTTAKEPAAKELLASSGQPAVKEKSKGLETPEDESLEQEATESEKPTAADQAEPTEKVASPASVDHRPSELGEKPEKPESHEAVDMGCKAVSLLCPGDDRSNSTQPDVPQQPKVIDFSDWNWNQGPPRAPSSPWSVEYHRDMPFTEAEFTLGRAYLQGKALLASLARDKAQPAEELLVQAQRCLVHFVGVAIPALKAKMCSVPWCLRTRKWLQYTGELERVAADKALREHRFLPVMLSTAAMRRRFRGALGQAVLDQADRDPLAVEEALSPTDVN